MNLHITYYGMLAEIAGRSEEILEEGEKLTVAALRERIVARYPQMGERKFKIAVNRRIADDMMPVDTNAEIALLPPFAGG